MNKKRLFFNLKKILAIVIFALIFCNIVPVFHISYAALKDKNPSSTWVNKFNEKINNYNMGMYNYINYLVLKASDLKLDINDFRDTNGDLLVQDIGASIKFSDLIDSTNGIFKKDPSKYSDADLFKSMLELGHQIELNTGKYNDEFNELWNTGKLTDDDKKYYWAMVSKLTLKAIYNHIDTGMQGKFDKAVKDKDGAFNLFMSMFDPDWSSVPDFINFTNGVDDANDKQTISDRFKALQTFINEYIKECEDIMSSLRDSGKVDDSVIDAGDQFEDDVDDAIKDANQAAISQWDGLHFLAPSVDANDLSMALDNILQGLKDKGEDTNISGMSGIVTDITTIVSSVGRYIMYALILFFGVKTIWEGVEGKAKFKELLPFLLIGVIFFWAAPGIVSLVQNIFEVNTVKSQDYLSLIFATIVYILRIVAFGGIVFTGVKLMFGAADKRAEAKSSLMPVLIGSIIVFAASIIIGLVLNIASDTGIETDKDLTQINSNSSKT